MLRRKRKDWEAELGKLATDPEFPCNESFSTQAEFWTLLYFDISPLGFFSCCPRLDVEGLDMIQEIILWHLPSDCTLGVEGNLSVRSPRTLRVGSDSRESLQ